MLNVQVDRIFQVLLAVKMKRPPKFGKTEKTNFIQNASIWLCAVQYAAECRTNIRLVLEDWGTYVIAFLNECFLGKQNTNKIKKMTMKKKHKSENNTLARKL